MPREGLVEADGCLRAATAFESEEVRLARLGREPAPPLGAGDTIDELDDEHVHTFQAVTECGGCARLCGTSKYSLTIIAEPLPILFLAASRAQCVYYVHHKVVLPRFTSSVPVGRCQAAGPSTQSSAAACGLPLEFARVWCGSHVEGFEGKGPVWVLDHHPYYNPGPVQALR